MRRRPPWTIITLIVLYAFDFVWGLTQVERGISLWVIALGVAGTLVFVGIPLSWLWEGKKYAWLYFLVLTLISLVSLVVTKGEGETALSIARTVVHSFLLLNPLTRAWVNDPHLEDLEHAPSS